MSEKVEEKYRESGKIGSIKKRVDKESRIGNIGTRLEESGT